MRWYDEIRLSRHSIIDIGIVFYIREMMHNRWSPTYADVAEVFGEGWKERLEALARQGILKVEWNRRTVAMTVVAPGDARRMAMRAIAAKCRKRNGAAK